MTMKSSQCAWLDIIFNFSKSFFFKLHYAIPLTTVKDPDSNDICLNWNMITSLPLVVMTHPLDWTLSALIFAKPMSE